MAKAIEITDEQYRQLNEMRRVDLLQRKKQFEPFKNVVQRLLDAYITQGKD
jgi:predicted CopG family antitoxin